MDAFTEMWDAMTVTEREDFMRKVESIDWEKEMMDVEFDNFELTPEEFNKHMNANFK